MADAVTAVTAAPKQAFRFAENHVLAFLLLVVLLAVIFVRLETKTPGAIRNKVGQIPGLGPWALGAPR